MYDENEFSRDLDNPEGVCIKDEPLDDCEEVMINEEPGSGEVMEGSSIFAKISNAVNVGGQDAVKALVELLKEKGQRKQRQAKPEVSLSDVMDDIEACLADSDSNMDIQQPEAKLISNWLATIDSATVSGSLTASTLRTSSTSSKLISNLLPSTSKSIFIAQRRITAPDSASNASSCQVMTPAKRWSTSSLASVDSTVSGFGSHPGSRLISNRLSSKAKRDLSPEKKEVQLQIASDKVRATTQAVLADLKHVPKLQRAPRGAAYQWTHHLTDSESGEDEVIPDLYSRQVSSSRVVKWAKSEKAWKKLYHGEVMAREHSEWTIPFTTPVMMQTLPLRVLKARLQQQNGYYVEKRPTQTIHDFPAGKTIPNDNIAVRNFINEAHTFRFVSFDTEGQGTLLSHTGKNDRLFVAYSSPKSAMVMFVHDARDTPEAIRKVLADYTVAKLQSGIAGDVELMEAAGIPVRGLVDTGTLFMLVKPGPVGTKFGAEAQIAQLWPDTKGVKHHNPYDYRTFAKCFETQKISMKAGRHVLQDILTPFATLFLATKLQAEHLKLGDEDDTTTLMHQALELCYSKSPMDVRQKSLMQEPHRYWYPQIEESEFRLNSRAMCHLIRRARGSIVEPFDNSTTMTERINSAKSIWDKSMLPSAANFKGTNYWLIRASQSWNAQRNLSHVNFNTARKCAIHLIRF